jgi:hypothetical protein
MARVDVDWRRDHQLWVELFVLANFAGLVVDIFLAHSENHFRRDSEYLPLYFSMAATIALAVAVLLRARSPQVWRQVGHVVGWLAVLVGLAGVILHLDSQFFHERTIRSLTYAAPFAAPLAFTGVGLLLILNRLVPPETPEWAQWVLLLTLGGFVGNFIFSLTDHAQNGFFQSIEWLPVISSACAIGFLIVPFLMRVGPSFLRLCAMILIVQGLVGILGFLLHAREMLRQASETTLLDRVLSGPPPLAPLLFPNLVILGLIGLWAIHRAASR